MTTLEIKASLLQEVAELLNHDENVEKMQRFVRRLKKSAGERADSSHKPLGGIPALQYSVETLNAILDRAEEGRIAGKYTPSEQVFDELKQEFPFLCK